MDLDSSENRQRAQPDVSLDNAVPDLRYETLKNRQTQDDSTYTELTSTVTEMASWSQKNGGKGLKPKETLNYSSPIDLTREISKNYEEPH